MLSYSLTHNETEDEEVGYALALATNPSCAFVIISVGMGLYNSYFYGICLYISIIISTIISGIIFKPKTQFISFPHDKARQRFSISDSIKASSHTCLYICAFIVFFSVLIELIENHLPITVFSEILLSFFEIGNGAVRLSALKLNYAIPLTAMMLGSTGLCAYVQVRAFVPDCISMKKYIFMKLTEAIFSFLLCTIIMSIALK